MGVRVGLEIAVPGLAFVYIASSATSIGLFPTVVVSSERNREPSEGLELGARVVGVVGERLGKRLGERLGFDVPDELGALLGETLGE